MSRSSSLNRRVSFSKMNNPAVHVVNNVPARSRVVRFIQDIESSLCVLSFDGNTLTYELGDRNPRNLSKGPYRFSLSNHSIKLDNIAVTELAHDSCLLQELNTTVLRRTLLQRLDCNMLFRNTCLKNGTLWLGCVCVFRF